MGGVEWYGVTPQLYLTRYNLFLLILGNLICFKIKQFRGGLAEHKNLSRKILTSRDTTTVRF